MKNLLLACFLFFVSLGTTADKPVRKHGILVNIPTIIVGNYEISYEHALSNNFSLATSVLYYEGRKAIWRVYSEGYSVALGFTPKLHIFGQAHDNSFYWAGSLRLGYVEHPARNENEKTDRGILSRLGANFGYQYVFGFGFMIDALAGLEHYYSFSLNGEKTRYQSSGEGKIRFELRPYFAVMMGYSF